MEIEDLKQAGYNVEYNKKTRKWEAWRGLYLDDGYGFYFTAEVYFEGTKQQFEDDEYAITVDGYESLGEIDKELDKAMNRCRLFNEYDICIMNENEQFTEEEYKIMEELIQDCGTCKYLSMIQMLFESLLEGNY